MFTIKCRYEHWSDSGKVFTRWYDDTINIETKEKAMEICKQRQIEADKLKTGLKSEYKVEES